MIAMNTKIKANAIQLLQNKYFENNKGFDSFAEWVVNESLADPQFFQWLFPEADNLQSNFGMDMNYEQKYIWNRIIIDSINEQLKNSKPE